MPGVRRGTVRAVGRPGRRRVEEGLRAYPTRAALVTGAALGVIAVAADQVVPALRVEHGPRWAWKVAFDVFVVLMVAVLGLLPQIARRRSGLPLATVAFAAAVAAVATGVAVAIAGASTRLVVIGWIAAIVILTSAATRLRHEETSL